MAFNHQDIPPTDSQRNENKMPLLSFPPMIPPVPHMLPNNKKIKHSKAAQSKPPIKTRYHVKYFDPSDAPLVTSQKYNQIDEPAPQDEILTSCIQIAIFKPTMNSNMQNKMSNHLSCSRTKGRKKNIAVMSITYHLMLRT